MGGQVFRSGQADALVRTELNGMDDEEAEQTASVYRDYGIGGLASSVITQQFAAELVNPYINIWTPASILANLAVAPSYRGNGLGRALCDRLCYARPMSGVWTRSRCRWR